MASQLHLTVKLAPLIVILLGLAGCASQRELPVFKPAVSQSAIIRWQRNSVSLTCDAIFARSKEGSAMVRIYKQSPAPLLELRLEPDNYLVAKGSLAGPGWSGQMGNAPAPLMVWTTLLTAYQNADKLPTGENEVHTASAHIAYVKTGETLKSLSVSRTDSEETITTFFK